METLPWTTPPKLPPRESPLSDQQRHFCDHYIEFPDEKLAAKSAGYHPNAKPLNSPKVLNEIRQRQAERTQKTDIDAGYLLTRLSAELEADLADLYDKKTQSIKPIHEWPLIWRKGLVAGVDIDILGNIKIKLSDRTKRLEMIGRHVNVQAFKERIEIDTTLNVNVNAVEMLEDYIRTINVTPSDVIQLPVPHAAE